MRSMGLDIGSRRIGVALSDALGITAQPLTVVERTTAEGDIDSIRQLASSNDVGLIVVGLPVRTDGSAGPEAERAARFAESLRKQLSIDVVTWDERFSTAAVSRVLIDADVSRRRRKSVIDKLAAAYLLQGYLDATRAGDKAP